MSEEMIHFWDLDGSESSACGVNLMTTPYTFSSPDWPDVTCAACKVREPAPLAAGTPARREQMIAECERVEARALAGIEGLRVQAGRASRLKHRLQRLSAAESAQNAPFNPLAFLDTLGPFARAQRAPLADWGPKPFPY